MTMTTTTTTVEMTMTMKTKEKPTKTTMQHSAQSGKVSPGRNEDDVNLEETFFRMTVPPHSPTGWVFFS